MSTWARDLRGVVFVSVATFVTLGPIRTQVLLAPSRSADHPLRPMAWQMYHRIGVDMCQAVFYDGARRPLPHDVVERAVGPARQSRYTIVRKARANDVLFADGELPELSRALCASSADVRADVRCAPRLPGGRWRVDHDGTVNLCAAPPAQRSAAPATAPDPSPGVGD